jgi:hypothetical protein
MHPTRAPSACRLSWYSRSGVRKGAPALRQLLYRLRTLRRLRLTAHHLIIPATAARERRSGTLGIRSKSTTMGPPAPSRRVAAVPPLMVSSAPLVRRYPAQPSHVCTGRLQYLTSYALEASRLWQCGQDTALSQLRASAYDAIMFPARYRRAHSLEY